MRSKSKEIIKQSWAGRCFQALDCENRGWLLKHEILAHLHRMGVYKHGAL
jgi:glutaminase